MIADAELVEAPTDEDDLLGYLTERGWGDGLPVVAPTRPRVERMLAANAALDPEELIGIIPPRDGRATIFQVTINAVMAGCRPEYLPVVVTALRCMVRPEWNLKGVQATTHPVAPLVVIHGPVARNIGANWGSGCFGPGYRANATIGRAVRLVMLNVGGGRPGAGDQSTQGQPSKYSYCIAENAIDSPWPPLHVARGLESGTSAVTVFGGTNPENVSDHVSANPVGVLTTMADVIATMGSNNTYYTDLEVVCVFCPEHAAIVADQGWSRDDVAHYLYEHAREPLGKLRRGGQFGMHVWPKWMTCETDDGRLMPVVRDPSDFAILVAGGPGKHSSVIKAMANNRSVTLPLPQEPAKGR
jgi:hypothetical protein